MLALNSLAERQREDREPLENNMFYDYCYLLFFVKI